MAIQAYKLAQEIGVSTQVILKTLKAWGMELSSHFSNVPEKLEKELRSSFEDKNAPPDPGKPRKKPTRPWEQKTWVPDTFRLDKKHKGFSPRFVDKKNVEKRIDEGWQVANISDYIDDKKVNQRQGNEEKGVYATALVRKGMVLMELPNEQMQQWREWLDYKTDKQSLIAQKKELLARTKKISEQLGSEDNLVTDDIRVE